MEYDWAVFGAWHDYGIVAYQMIESFDTEEEAEAAVERIAQENRYNSMYEWFVAREI